MATWFFTYGNEKFKYSKARIKEEAESSGFFDHILVFGPEDLDKEFIQKTKPYISAARGGGYWLWKAFFLKQIFAQMNEGDYCFYIDAGCTVNSAGKKRFSAYLTMLDSSESGCLGFALVGFNECEWTNKMTLAYFNSDDSIKKSPQIITGFIMFKKDHVSGKIIEEFYNIAISRPDLFADQVSSDELPSFKAHRHDQSIWSILGKKYNILQIPDETYGENMLEKNKVTPDFMSIPFLATRIKDPKRRFLSGLKRLFYRG